MYYFLVFAIVCMYVYVVNCFWPCVREYPVQPSSDQFEQQQEQFEEGKYNMNTTYHFKYIFILHFNIVRL